MRNYWWESSGGLRGWWGDWSISPMRKGWGSWACLAWRRLRGDLLSFLSVGVRRMRPNSFQRCSATGQGATSTNWSMGSSSWTWGRTSLLWAWQSTATGCPEGLWILLLWTYSNPAWTQSCATWCRWPCFGRRGGWTRWSPEVPSNSYHSVILWFSFHYSNLSYGKKHYIGSDTLTLIITNNSASVWPKAQPIIVLLEFH